MSLLRIFAILAVLNIAAVIALYASFLKLENYDSISEEKYDQRHIAFQLADNLRQDSASLTRLARVYATTGEERFAKQYNAVLDISLGFIPRPKNYYNNYWDFHLLSDEEAYSDSLPVSLLELIQDQNFSEEEVSFFKHSEFLSNELAKVEMRVFQEVKLLKEEFGLDNFKGTNIRDTEFSRRHRAILNRLYDDAYNLHLVNIAEPITQFFKSVEKRTNEELLAIENKIRDQRSYTFIIFIFLISVFVGSFLIIYNRVVKAATALSNSFTRLASGDLSTEIPAVNRSDEFGDMANSAQLFKQALLEKTDQNWIQSYANKISNNLQQARQIDEAAKFILNDLTESLNCVVGSFFYFNTDYDLLQRLASFGLAKKAGTQSTFELGDGLVGQCAISQRLMEIHNIPDEYSRVVSGSGSLPVKRLYLIPVVHNEQLYGVLELGAFDPLGKIQHALLDSITPVLALYLENLTRASKTEGLLVRSQNQAQELLASEEELRSQGEEVRASNEELRAKTQQLAEKTSALQASDEELRMGNEELSIKTKILEQRQRDLSDAKNAAEIFAEEMRKANHYKSQFLANMSHELRTPLNSLLILARLLSENKNGNLLEDDIEAATIIHESGKHLLTLINDILDLSKTEAGKTELRPEKVEVKDLLSMVRSSFSPIAISNETKFEIKTSNDVADIIYSDPTKLQQVLNNLLSNAFKFTEKGKVSLNVDVPLKEEIEKAELDPTIKYIAFRVKDSGIGMTQKQLPKVFEAFRQADGSTSRKYGGTGLGLTITKSLVEIMGGYVGAHSEEGKGTTFVVILPEHYEAIDDEEIESDPFFANENTNESALNFDTLKGSHAPSHAPAIGEEAASRLIEKTSKNVGFSISDDRDNIVDGQQVMLIIEDDKVFATLLMKQVQKRGFKGVIATDPDEGLALAKKLMPTGIILDINLPGTDGWEVLRKLQENREISSIPVHILSGEEDLVGALDKGAVGFAMKPIGMDTINEVISRLDMSSKSDRNILMIEDDYASQVAIGKVMEAGNISVTFASTSKEGLALLNEKTFDCIILDLGLPDEDGFEFLRAMKATEEIELPPVVIYSGRELERAEIEELREYTDSVVIKGDRSAERLLSEVNLFLHSVVSKLPQEQKEKIHKSKTIQQKLQNVNFNGAHVLLVDDDMRNVFALSKVLKDFGCHVTIAKNGLVSLDKLSTEEAINIILMDIMMPEMDGMSAIKKIREQPQFDDIPIIAVTAKAMAGEKQKCIAAGADDYLPKPVDVDELAAKMLALL